MLNKDVTHPKMRRRIENPRIVLLDCTLEYKKGESQTNVEIVNESEFTKILQLEEEYVEKVCNDIIALKPDLIFTEKGEFKVLMNHLKISGEQTKLWALHLECWAFFLKRLARGNCKNKRVANEIKIYFFFKGFMAGFSHSELFHPTKDRIVKRGKRKINESD
jgi:Chaperonin GroEL (HSP60 family)